MFVVGEEAGLFVIDLDRKNEQRADHEGKVDGIEFFEDWCGPVDARDTFTSRTIGGGCHKVYRYTPELDGKLKSGQLTPLALCDILFNGRGFTFGEGYEIINRVLPQEPPKSVINFIVNNAQQTVVNLGNVQQQTNVQQNVIAGALGVTAATSLSDRINQVIGAGDMTWRVNNFDDAAYQLIPNTRECCVQPGYHHSSDSHSCLYVRKTALTANCFSHGNRVIAGDVSRNLRDLFFEIGKSNRGQGVMVEIVHRITSLARSEGLVRENGAVLRRVGGTHAFAYVDGFKEFLRRTLRDDVALKERPRRFNDLLIFMTNIDSVDFPFITRNKRYIGFTNGLFDMVDGHAVGDHVLEHGVVPRHCINQALDLDDVETPLFDRLVLDQLASEELYTYLLALIGRLFYDVGQFDRLDIIPFIIGDTNTGKSTLVDIIRAMFAPDAVGVLDSSHEIVFGLQSKHTKELIVAPEITDRMAQQLASDMFKKMICGELVNLPIKHGEALFKQWTVPMFMCGNRYMSYHDDKGSISRRLAIFKFEHYVVDMDDSLKQRIIDHELAKIVVKCLKAYRLLLDHVGNRGFWNTCPAYFWETRDEMTQCTDYLYMFLTLGPDENAWSNKVLYFVKVRDQCMLLEEFKKKFRNYLRFRHPHVRYKWDQDLSAFKRLGYEIVSTKVCRSCLQEARNHCCQNYGHANRSTRRVIRHIVCVEKELENDHE